MIGRYEAYMDGAALSAIDGNIYILDIKHTPAAIQRKTNRVANRAGERAYGQSTGNASVVITFEIHEYNTAKRQAICDKIAAWAAYGVYLTTSDKPWRRLKCVCDKMPVLQAKKWTEPISMTFGAYNPPYWEEMNPTTVTLGGTGGATSGSGTAYVPGNVKGALIGATITAKAAISDGSVALTANGKTITLSGLTLSSGDTVTIGYDDDLFMTIKKGTTSILEKRTGASADDLLADCGKSNSFSFTASGNVIVAFQARGWWI